MKPWSLLPCLLLPVLAAAQYKIVDAQGRVTYTDRPGSVAANAKVTELRRGALAAPDTGVAGLPYELRLVVLRHPVVLFTTANCPPCDSGKQLLTQRGVPFTERRIVTESELQEAERTLGWRTVPSLTIGAQALRGWGPDEWAGYLDAAGYPRESRLPRGWLPAAPSASAPATAPAGARPTP